MQWDPSQSDHILLTAWARGDQGAAAAFVKKYYAHAFVIGLGHCQGNKEQAETAVQTFFERLSRRISTLWQKDRDRFDSLSHNFLAYLLTALKNNIREQIRASSKYRIKIVDQAGRAAPDIAPSASDKFMREDAIRYILSFLPESQRRVYKLYLEGYSHQEIARKIGLKQGQVRGRIDRGNQKLKQHRQLIHQLLQP